MQPAPSANTQPSAPAAVPIDESEIVRRHSGKIGWPTVLLCLALSAAYTAVIIGWTRGAVPLWAGFLINAAITFAFYTVHHDANHKAISGRRDRWRWLDTACGSIAAMPLVLSFKGWSAEHLRHHAYTNDPARDPDFQVAGPLSAIPMKWMLGTVFSVIGALPNGDRIVARIVAKVMPGGPTPAAEPNDRLKQEHQRIRRYQRIALVALLGSIPAGLFVPALFLWWLPGRVGVLGLVVFFQWLPHVPYDDTSRYRNTRINTFPGSTWLLFQQDYHLIHHLYPSVPWYRYRAVFREVRPLLEAQGARIEGRGTNPYRPIQLRFKPTI